MKRNIILITVRLTMLHGAATLTIIRGQENKMAAAEMSMLRFMIGVTRRDKIRNEYISDSVKCS